MSPRVQGALACVVVLAAGGIAGAQRRDAPDGDRGHRGTAHGSITAAVECSACHTPEGWDVAGAGAGDTGFDHGRTGFPLTGRHQTVPCATCHTPGRTLSRECASCHRDEHSGRLGRTCDRCHSAVAWERTDAIAAHRSTRLPLTGMHVLADCSECHRRNDGRGLTGTPAECYACHEDDYRRPDVHPIHQGTADSPPFPRDCSLCHAPTGWSPAFVDPDVLPRSSGLRSAAEHDRVFPIGFGPHRGADCESCHESLAVPRAVRCTGCHAHGAARIRAVHSRAVPTDGAACLSCHPGGTAR